MISGTTRFAVMLGHPVAQVGTPATFNAWAAAAGVDAVMIALDVAPKGVAPTLAALREWDNCIGAVVTIPHKQAVVAQLDSADAVVRLTGAANVIRRAPSGALHGGMTDGLGFVAALAKNGCDPKGASVRLIGAGGAGSAIAHSLLDAGVARLMIHDLDGERRQGLANKLRAMYAEAILPDAEAADFSPTLVVNATPVGMNGDQKQPYPIATLRQDCFVADIVSSPTMTPWLTEARRRGHPVQTGKEMIEAQFPFVRDHLMPEKIWNLP